MKYLDDFCTIYINNIIIYFNSKKEYKKYVIKILIKLLNVDLL